jgi:methylenetetrahydrofolate reductase (NADPH)
MVGVQRGRLDFGLEVLARVCETLLANGVRGLHFYILNQAAHTLRLRQR